MKIDKGVPIPAGKVYEPRSKIGQLVIQMEAGDSILCETESEMWNVRSTMRYMGWKAKSRKMNSGWRIWRIA